MRDFLHEEEKDGTEPHKVSTHPTGGAMIDFHPSQQLLPGVTGSPPPLSSEENADTHRRAISNQH